MTYSELVYDIKIEIEETQSEDEKNKWRELLNDLIGQIEHRKPLSENQKVPPMTTIEMGDNNEKIIVGEKGSIPGLNENKPIPAGVYDKRKRK